MNRWEWGIVSILGILLVTLVGVYFFQFRDFYKGLVFLKNKNYLEAKENFLKVLSRDVHHIPGRLNLALIESLQKNVQNSLGEYEIVGKESPYSQERFHSYFNSGHLIYESNRDLDQAIDFYQKALNENPSSIEAKTNIELMFQESQQNSQSKDGDSKDSQPQESQESQEGETPQELNEQNQEPNFQNFDSLSEEQVRSILDEIEENEQETKARLQKVPQEFNKRKQW